MHFCLLLSTTDNNNNKEKYISCYFYVQTVV
jgi:hypothetical protein